MSVQAWHASARAPVQGRRGRSYRSAAKRSRRARARPRCGGLSRVAAQRACMTETRLSQNAGTIAPPCTSRAASRSRHEIEVLRAGSPSRWPLLVALPAQAQTEIQWWHSMGGQLGEWVNDLAKGFNDSQKDYKVVPTFKGNYAESLTAAHRRLPRRQRAAHPAGVRGRHGDDDGQQGRDRPGGKVMKDRRREVRPDVYVPAVAGYYTAPNGQMLSLPFNSSTTVFHYNKDAFKAAGLDPEKPPTTWPEVALRRRQAQGRRPQVPVHHQLAELDAAGKLLGLAQRRVRDQEQRLRRPGHAAGRSTRRCTCATSRTWPTWPSRACSSTRAATTRPTPPSSRASAP